MLGVDFEGTDATSMDDGISFIPTIGGSGAKYLQTIMRASIERFHFLKNITCKEITVYILKN